MDTGLGAERTNAHFINLDALTGSDGRREYVLRLELSFPWLFGRARIELWPEEARRLGQALIDAANHERMISVPDADSPRLRDTPSTAPEEVPTGTPSPQR
jgi:hypothetical protein